MVSSPDPQLLLWQDVADVPAHSRGAHAPPGHSSAPVTLPPCQALQQLALAERQDEARQSIARLGAAPTPDQWKMILSPTTATCVIAGAGSGKSTTLILRLLVLHKLLGIPLDDMHVFSFSRSSTGDFQEKLALNLALWEELVEQRTVGEQRRAELRRVAGRAVSTFHSVIARLSPAAVAGDFAGFFDLARTASPADGDEEAGYNPFLVTRLSARQQEILNAAHTQAYEREPAYRAGVTELLEEEMRQQWMRGRSGQELRAEAEPTIWQAFLRQERTYHGFEPGGTFAPHPGFQDRTHSWHVDPYRAAVADRLRELGVPFVPLPTFPIRCPILGGQDGQLHAAFQVGKLFLHIERFAKSAAQADRRLAFHERDRRKFIALYTRHFDHHKVLTPADFVAADGGLALTPHGDLLLQVWLASQGHASAAGAAPVLRVKVPGGLHRLHLVELLYQEGLFIESLGLEVEQVQLRGALDPISRIIAGLLPLFWRSFRAELASRRYLRFHDVLAVLRQEETLRALRGQLRHLKHLFVDEFQDVSPEIVDWLAKTLAVHVRDGGEEVSVTCIGDDHQSIYGWRGSHPIFLMEFARYFPAAQQSQVVLRENFRSLQPIIDAAEAALQDVRHKIARHGESFLPGAIGEAVGLREARLAWGSPRRDASAWHAFSQFVGAALRALSAAGHFQACFKGRQTLSVFILARTNATTARIQQQRLGEQLIGSLRELGIEGFRKAQVRVCTFHRSKGLEADFVLLLEDSLPPEQHQLRELVFKQSPFLGEQAGSYLQNVTDEARRLAYVALTRARFGVLWLPQVDTSDPDMQGSVGEQQQRDGGTSPQGSFALVKRYERTLSERERGTPA